VNFWSKISSLGTRCALIYRYPSRSCIMVFTPPTLIPISSEISCEFMHRLNGISNFFTFSSVILLRGWRIWVSFSTRSRPFLNAEHHFNTWAFDRHSSANRSRSQWRILAGLNIFFFLPKKTNNDTLRNRTRNFFFAYRIK
jgi:hypothetical protein